MQDESMVRSKGTHYHADMVTVVVIVSIISGAFVAYVWNRS